MNQLQAENELVEDRKRMLEQTLVRTNAYIFGNVRIIKHYYLLCHSKFEKFIQM